jgi:branched-chain amino acid transport system permease protein
MLGYNTFVFKLMAIVVAGVIASGASVLRGLVLKTASPEVLSLTFTFDPVLMTPVGGTGTFLGPVASAFSLHLRDTVLRLGGLEINIGERRALILGVLWILSVIVLPYGRRGHA